MTHASRDTTTGLNFEKQIVIKNDGICLTKNNLYKYLEKNGIDCTTILSRKLLPDEAYYNPTTKEFSIFVNIGKFSSNVIPNSFKISNTASLAVFTTV